MSVPLMNSYLVAMPARQQAAAKASKLGAAMSPIARLFTSLTAAAVDWPDLRTHVADAGEVGEGTLRLPPQFEFGRF